MSDFGLKTSKLENLIRNDYDRLKHQSDLRKLEEEDLKETEYQSALKSLATAIETRNHITTTTLKLKYKLLYGCEPPEDLF